jgi:PEP-CTERM motif-containing protein
MRNIKMTQFKWLALSAGVGLAIAGAVSSAARADVVVDVYEYAGNTVGLGTDASAATLTNILAHPGSFTHYEFTYTALNDILWQNPGPQSGPNLASQFVNAADITSFSGGPAQETAFLGSTLSVKGDQQTAFFNISGFITGTITPGANPPPAVPTGSFISHDDGATFVIGGVTQFSNAPETNDAIDLVPGGTFAGAAFNLYYVEGNGAPSILDVHLAGANLTTDVPEPATWAMMILGFFGVGFMAYRRQSKFALRLA